MTGETFEYAIKKDVRNNPIVREVDRERHRELWRSTLVGAFLVAVLVFSVWRHLELLQHGYELDGMQSDVAREMQTNRHLRLERESLRAPKRIEELARRELHMVTPGPADQEVIERVLPGPPAPSSAVALREP